MIKKAKAAVFTGIDQPFDVRTFNVTSTPSGYGRSELIASGVCGTDVHMHKGKLLVTPPTVIGHEFVGRLVDCDEAEAAAYGLKKGDTVMADIAVPCGECLLCKSGDDANCVRMQVTNGGSIEKAPYLWGGYAEVNYTPLSNLIRIPDGLDPLMATVFACPGPTVLHAVSLAEQAGVKVGECEVALVQGLGPVGTFAALALKALGVKKVYATCAGNNTAREELARSLGVDEVLNLTTLGEEEVTRRLCAEHDGLGVDLVVEASGAPNAVPQGMDVLRNRGVYLIPGQYSNRGPVAIHPETITFKALHLIGSSQYSIKDVKAYMQFLLDHPDLHAKIRALATTYPISEVNRAFEDAEAGRNVKTLLIPG